MPLYDFECRECGHQFEDFCQAAARNDPRQCPECKGVAVRKLSVPQDHRGVWKQPRDPNVLMNTPEIWPPKKKAERLPE
jgi:putative FmdB family regulatory protein